MTTGEDERHVGPYRLIEHLGRGGMGEVWLAEDVTGAAGGAPRRVALKLLDHRWLDDGEARARFAREVAAARLVRGPGVAALLDADVEAAQPWLASAYVAGPTLEEHVSRHGPLADGPLRALGAALADALVSIHAVGVVHRDLTPRNVVLGPDGPRVVDFGIAWYAEAAAITEAGARVGTPAWMPPERLSGDVVSPAGDVWSWGAVMAYAARGRPVVIGGSPEVVTDPGLQGEADLAGVPGWLEPWVRAALSTDPAVRPASDALLAAMSAPRSSPAVPGTDAAAAPTAVEHAPLPTVAFDADSTRVQGPGVAAGPPAPAGPAPPGASEAAAVTGAIGPRDAQLRRRRTIRWVSAAVILVAAVAVGFFAGLLGAVIVTAVLVILAVALRLGRENQPSDVPPVPPTWAVALAVPAVLGTALMQAFGVVVGAAALLGLVVLFFVLGGDIA